MIQLNHLRGVLAPRYLDMLYDEITPMVDYGDGDRFHRVLWWHEPRVPFNVAMNVEMLLGYFRIMAPFDHVTLVAYRDQDSWSDWHTDEAEHQAILSLGATRTFGISTIPRFGTDEWYLPLHHGDLMYFPPGWQEEWHHSIRQHTTPCGPRYALVFRTGCTLDI